MADAVISPDPEAVSIARHFLARIQNGLRIEEAWLYGSRARGDAHPDSDLDLAIVVHDTQEAARRFGSVLAGEAIDELLGFGVLISPLVIAKSDWDRPQDFSNPFLLRNVRQHGVRL